MNKTDTELLDAFIAQSDAIGTKVIAKTAFAIEATAKTLAPVDTGALRNSIVTEEISHKVLRVSDSVEYGIFQELGTSRNPAQPFMVPAVEAESRNVSDWIAEEIGKVLGE